MFNRLKVISLLVSLILFASGAFAETGIANDFSGSGVSHGLISVTAVDAGALRGLLPPGLSLAPEQILPNGFYPAAMFIGRHENLTAKVGESSLMLEKRYNEAALTVVVVGPHSSGSRYLYTAEIVVDAVVPQLIGQALGYPKRLVQASQSDSTFTASFPDGRPAIDLSWRNIANYDRSSFLRLFNQLMSHSIPTIGHTPFGFICFDYKWDFTSGNVVPVDADIRLYVDFVGAAKLAGHFTSPGLADQGAGSVYIVAPWKMDHFRACQ